MYKKNIFTALALVTLAATAAAQTAAEKTAMSQVMKVFDDGFTYLDAGDYAKSYTAFKQCSTIINANPGIKKQKVNDAGLTYAGLMENCLDMSEGGLELLSWDTINAQRMRDYLKKLDSLSGEECYEMANAIIVSHPALAQVYTKSKITVGKRRAECEKEMLASKPISSDDKQQAQALAPLVPQLAKLRADLKSALALPEKTDANILQKYKLMDGLDRRAQDFTSQLALADKATVRRVPVGNTTVGALIDDAVKAQREVAQALATLKKKSDAAFDRQDAAVKVELPKILKGDKLSIYKRQGIPSDFSGGPVFSKNGVFSGDGKAVAKDIASATLWFYNDNGKGCTYKYWFSGNTVSKVEKPLNC